MAFIRVARPGTNYCMVGASEVVYLPLSCVSLKRRSSGVVTELRQTSSSETAFRGLRSQPTNSRSCINFSHQQTGPFTQAAPTIANSFDEDVFLQAVLEGMLPVEVLDDIKPELLRFGERCVTDIYADHVECSRVPPKLQKYDVFGNHIDKVITSPAWKRMKTTSAEEGLISIAYERKYGEWSRLYQMLKILMFGASSGLYNCPLAMTDGAATVIEKMPCELRTKSMSAALKRLTSRDPTEFWTSGQWMTEKAGGSDVRSATQTLAIKDDADFYRLYGFKWFSSACDGEMAFTLAKIGDETGTAAEDSSPTMFYVETCQSVAAQNASRSSSLNNIHILQLKDKFGTRQLPTGELLLDGTVAEIASDRGKGISSISSMLNITRLHNAAAAVSTMRRVTNIARDYSKRRTAFGRLLSEYSLHVRTLNALEVETRVNTLVFVEAARLLGRQECPGCDDADALKRESYVLRILLPLLKLYTGKQAVAVCSEAMEAVGGIGYLEDSQMPGYLRDAQVLPIWEGTTNVLALDALRALNLSDDLETRKEQRCAAFDAFEAHVREKSAKADYEPVLKHHGERVIASMNAIKEFVYEYDGAHQQKFARELAFSMYKTYAAALLIELIGRSGKLREKKDVAGVLPTLLKWCASGLLALTPECFAAGDHSSRDEQWLFEASSGFNKRGGNNVKRYPV